MSIWISYLNFEPSVWARIREGGYSLQCHLDVNGVILGRETIDGNVTLPHEYAAVMLAYGTYAKWKPDQEETSYKAHVWEHLHPGPNSDKTLRTTRKETLKQFVKTLADENSPLAEKVSSQYQKLTSILKTSPIFPGFPNLVQTLKDQKIPHQLIFRTFGGDVDFLTHYLSENYPEIKLKKGTFDEQGVFHYEKKGQEILVNNPHQFREAIQIGHWIIQDNFNIWQRGGEAGNSGKLFSFSSDPENPILSIFADDNLEIVDSGDQRTIVCCYDTKTNKSVSTREASSRLIKVNPIDAALDPNYLTNRISSAAERLLTPQQNSRDILKLALMTVIFTAIIFEYAFMNRSTVN